tara:strand:- start:249 stop:401 length:153 start_codon:yes stop_codon:yes gene_type:complete
MTQTQLATLKKDSSDLKIYAKKLEKRGLMERMRMILEKQAFLEKRIAEAS